MASRRPTAAWIVCLALLAIAFPASACAAAAQASDCCPDTAPMPCGNGGQEPLAGAICCVEAPDTAKPMAVPALRAAPGDGSESGSPDAAMPGARDFALTPVVASPATWPLAVAPAPAGPIPVYLRTGRLRL